MFEKYLKENYSNLQKLAFNLCNHDYDNSQDILQECLLYLLEKKIDVLDSFVDKLQLDKYLNSMIRFSYFSHTSSYQNKYKNKKIDKELYILENENSFLCNVNIYDIINKFYEDENIDWYKRKLFDMKISGYSYYNLNKETGIPLSSLYDTYNKTVIKLKKYIDKNNFCYEQPL